MADQSAMRMVIAERLDHLFAVFKDPGGRRYTMRQVVDAINAEAGEQIISVQYLSQLRLGQRKVPSYEKLQAIAKFFGVSPAYFSDNLAAEQADEQIEIVKALRDAGVRSVAMRARGLSQASLEQVRALLEHVRELEGLPPSDDNPG